MSRSHPKIQNWERVNQRLRSASGASLARHLTFTLVINAFLEKKVFKNPIYTQRSQFDWVYSYDMCWAFVFKSALDIFENVLGSNHNLLSKRIFLPEGNLKRNRHSTNQVHRARRLGGEPAAGRNPHVGGTWGGSLRSRHLLHPRSVVGDS